MAEEGDLLIGLGNPLRGDDGVGAWLARRVRPGQPAGRVLVVQQLTPELAEALAASRRVLFIDAWCPPGLATGTPPLSGPTEPADPLEPAPAVRPLSDPRWPEAGGATTAIQPRLRRLAHTDGPMGAGGFTHALDPAQLLAITTLLHGRAPEAWQLLVPAWAMPHGEGFSPQLQRQLPVAEALLQRWCTAGAERCSGRASARA